MDKLCCCLLFIFLLAGMANAQKITLTAKGLPLADVFHTIEKQTGYFFLYEEGILKNSKPVTIQVSQMALPEVLDLIFGDQPLSYKIFDHNIVVRANGLRNPATGISIHGRALNENEAPVTAATVRIKDSQNGTTTDEEGRFVLANVPPNGTLIFSGANVETLEIPVLNRLEISVVLKTKVNKLEEVQVIAYGSTTRKLSTGSYSKITSSEIESQPVADPLSAMEGRAPGLFVTQTNGLPGSQINVLIRGQNSISSGNQPLFLVDGVPFSNNNMAQLASANNGQTPFASLNPADIESIEVLKDADATAIYGSRGANGVILITTKKGSAGKTRFSLNAYTGAGRITRSMPWMNTRQYLAMRQEGFVNDSIVPNAEIAPDLYAWDTTADRQWQKTLIGGTAKTTDVQASISGGDAKTQFLIATNYHYQSTVFPGSNADNRLGLHMNHNHRSADSKFNSNLNIIYSFDDNRLIQSDLTNSINSSPDAPNPYDSAGKLNWSAGGANYDNPLAPLYSPHRAKTDNLIGEWNLSFEIIKNLFARVNLGYTITRHDETQLTPLSSLNPLYSFSSGFASYASNSVRSWIIEPQAEYTLHFAKSKLNFLLGTAWQNQTTGGQVIYGFNYPNDALLADPTSAGSSFVQGSNSVYRYQAVFGRINYNFDDRILINGTARRDGSSRFGYSRQYADFGALGAAWIFLRPTDDARRNSMINYGKLRASYGVTGNDQIGDYQYLNAWQATLYPYQQQTGLIPERLSNPDYEWEINRKFEMAVELGFWQSRLLVTLNYFRSRSGNQLINYTLPIQTGFSSIIENLPAKVQNQGWELDLSSINIRSKEFSWTSSFNLTIARNKLLAFPGLSSSSYANQYVIGQPLTVLKLLHAEGVDPTTGVFTFNGVSIPEDQTSIRNISPRFYGGLLNTFSFKKWKLDIFIQFVEQDGKNYISSLPWPGYMINQPVWVMDHWQKAGDIKPEQIYSAGYNNAATAAYSNYRLSDAIVSNASYLRLKNVNLQYAISDKWLVYLQAQNFFTLSNYKGLDPETQNSSALPPLKMLTAGFHFTF